MEYNTTDLSLFAKAYWAIVAFSILWTILSIYMAYWGYKRKGVVGLLLAIFLNWIGWIIIACLPKDDKDRERESRIKIRQGTGLWTI